MAVTNRRGQQFEFDQRRFKNQTKSSGHLAVDEVGRGVTAPENIRSDAPQDVCRSGGAAGAQEIRFQEEILVIFGDDLLKSKAAASKNALDRPPGPWGMNPERDRVTKMQMRFDFSINTVNSFRRDVRTRARRDRYSRLRSTARSMRWIVSISR